MAAAFPSRDHSSRSFVGSQGFFRWRSEYWLFLDFISAARNGLHGGFAHKRPRQVVPIWEQISGGYVGVQLLQRETSGAKAVGGASTVKVDRRNEEDLDGAQRAVQSGDDSRSRLGKGHECAIELRFWRAMWPRETTARSGDIGTESDRGRQSQCLRVLEQSTVVRDEAKNTKSLAARVTKCGAGGQPMPNANAMWSTKTLGAGKRYGRAVMCKRRHRQRIG